jgi:hypothetical protein
MFGNLAHTLSLVHIASHPGYGAGRLSALVARGDRSHLVNKRVLTLEPARPLEQAPVGVGAARQRSAAALFRAVAVAPELSVGTMARCDQA